MHRLKIYLVFALLAITLSACSSSEKLQSGWSQTAIAVDGNYSDWQNSIQPIENKKVSVAFKNDDKFLYICLVTEDRAKAFQFMRGGFITWFIPENSKATFGIKFPLAGQMANRDQKQQFNREMFQPGNLDKMVNQFLERQNEFQIINAEKYPITLLPIINNQGIKAKLGYTEGKFVYELQVPLGVHDNFDYQIASIPGESLTVRFETEEIEGGGMQRSGLMQQGSGGGQMRGNRPGAGLMQMMEPFNHSVEIKLSTAK